MAAKAQGRHTALLAYRTGCLSQQGRRRPSVPKSPLTFLIFFPSHRTKAYLGNSMGWPVGFCQQEMRGKKKRERERKGSWDSAGKFLHCLRAAGQWGWCECSHLGAFLVGFFRLKMCFPGCVFCWRANAILCLFLLGFLVELPERLLSV